MAAPHNDNIRAKILEGASELMKTRTFNQISLAAIATKAGVSKGSVYYYYKSKNEILYDIADDYMAILYTDLRNWIEDKGKDTSLPRLIKYAMERGELDPGKGLRLHLTLEAVNGDERVREKLIARYKLFSEELGTLVAQRLSSPKSGKSAKKTADPYFYGWLLIMLIDGLMLQSLLDNPDIDDKKIANGLVGLLSNK